MNSRAAFGTAAYVPYAVGCCTRTLQPVPGFPRILEPENH
jgi:hypothetical protein